MLTKCLNCGFWVKSDDAFCLNCGIVEPVKNHFAVSGIEKFLNRLLRSPVLNLIFSAIVTFFLFDWFIGFANNFSRLQTLIQIAAFILWLASASALFLFLRKFQLTRRPKTLIKVKENLTSRSDLTDRRLFELQRRLSGIDAVLEKIGDEEPGQLRGARSKLLSAREIVMAQISRYRLQESKIVLVRLQNDLQPYLFGRNNLGDFQTEKGLATIENVKSRVNRISRDLGQNQASEHLSNERNKFKEQLVQTVDSCDKLRDGLLSLHAAQVIADIRPIDKNLPDRIDVESDHSVETFNLQATLTDFTESFEELEREYQRLRSENDTAKLIS